MCFFLVDRVIQKEGLYVYTYIHTYIHTTHALAPKG
jgi:hypothetical protein